MTMRVAMTWLGLALAACSSMEASLLAPAPPTSVYLQASPLDPGQVFVVTTVVPEGTSVYVFGSPTGEGSGTCLPRGECLSLALPNVLLGSGIAGVDGRVQVRVRPGLTAGLVVGREVYLQAAALTQVPGSRVITFSPVLVKVAGDLDGDGVVPPLDCDDTNPALNGSDADGDTVIDCDDPCPLDEKDLCLCSPGQAPGLNGCEPCAAGTYSADGAACVACPVGTASNSVESNSCKLCGIGRYADTPGSTQCDPCPVGTASDVMGAETCEPCAEGTVSPIQGADQCQTCSPGTEAAGDGIRCTPCVPGTASADGSSCDVCDPGTVTEDFGRDTCVACDAGTIPNGSATACEACPVGTYAEAGDATCTRCGLGTYASLPGMGMCTLCAPGQHAPVEGLESCEDCPIDSYTNVQGASTCTPCEPPTFTEVAGSNACDACQVGTYRDIDGRTCLDCPVFGVACDDGGITPLP